MSRQVTRREFLNLLAASAGTTAVLQASTALGLIPSNASAASLELSAVGADTSRRAVILGAGLSGLTVAYELSKAGYDCIVLEASHRPGGRIFTVRSGDLIDELGNRQYCEFDDEPHMYFNAGAARIPTTHHNILAYCKELGVELEVFINENKTSYVQDDNMLGGKPIRNIDYTTNTKGLMAEIMAKALSNAELDQPFSETEVEKLLTMARSFGDLSEDDIYRGSFRAGYASGGFLEHGVQKDMISYTELLKSNLGRGLLSANEGDTGPMLMQARGGMDKIIEGFTNQVGHQIRYRAAATSVLVNDDGVDVTYEQDGTRQQIKADYCFNCIPSHIMVGIENNFPQQYLKAMKYVRRGTAYKSAFQARERFWENEGIYGGISWTNQLIQQIWYPSHGIHKAKGIILSAYDYGDGLPMTNLTHLERMELALSQGEKIHPDYRNKVEKGISIAWHRMNHMLGCSARWNRSRGGWSHEEEQLYHTLQAPVNGRHYLIGDQMTMHSAWQESAVLSAHWAMADLDQRVRSENA